MKIIFIILILLNFGCVSLKNRTEDEKALNKDTGKEIKSPTEATNATNKKPITLVSVLSEDRNLASKTERVEFCNFINEHSEVFEEVQFLQINCPPATVANRQVEAPFSAKFEANGALSPSSLKTLQFIVEYPVRSSVEIKNVYERCSADENGVVSFLPPKSAFAIDGEIKIYLNILKGEDLEEDASSIKEHIASNIKDKLCTSFPYRVATNNKRISAAIAILDYDQDRKPNLKDNKVANQLFVRMMKAGYGRAGLAPFEGLAKLSDAEIIESAKNTFNGVIEYYFYGKTYITSLKKSDDGTWLCEIEGRLEIWNLKQTKKLFEFNLSSVEKGKNQWEAIQNARIALGAKKMYEKILYNL